MGNEREVDVSNTVLLHDSKTEQQYQHPKQHQQPNNRHEGNASNINDTEKTIIGTKSTSNNNNTIGIDNDNSNTLLSSSLSNDDSLNNININNNNNIKNDNPKKDELHPSTI